MVRLNITVNDDALVRLQGALASFGAGVLPATEAAVKTGANLVRKAWTGFALGGSLPGITENLKQPSGKYARSIKIRRDGPFNYEIYSDSEVAGWIEHGTKALDMKTTHPFGPRSRITKYGKNKGYPYLIVPFRWGTPGAAGFKNVMPVNVYETVKPFVKMRTLVSADVSKVKTPNAQTPSKMVGRAQYNRGYGRLKETDIDGTGEEKSRMSGMVRSADITGKNRSGGYFTFRVISAAPGAKGWIKPETRPRPVTRAVANVTRDVINKMVGGAVTEDLRNL